jgi:hypothetical protein
VFGLASEMLLSSFSFAFQPMRVGELLVAVKLLLLPMLSTLELRHLLVLLTDVLSIPQGLQILRAI